jgi:hypothetical protein
MFSVSSGDNAVRGNASQESSLLSGKDSEGDESIIVRRRKKG